MPATTRPPLSSIVVKIQNYRFLSIIPKVCNFECHNLWFLGGYIPHKSMRTSHIDRCEPRYAGTECTNRENAKLQEPMRYHSNSSRHIYSQLIKPEYSAKLHICGSEEDCSSPIANAQELLQSCTEPSIYYLTTCTLYIIQYAW